MQVIVSGRHVDVGDSLKNHIDARMGESISKYIDRLSNVNVVVAKEAHNFRIDISGNLGTHAGMNIKSRAEASDVYAAFDAAADKIEKQLRRYKRKITNHNRADYAEARRLKATKYILQDHEEDHKEDAPLVIAEKDTDIETLTVSEAVMRMDLSDLPALMFINSAHGRINVVYRRADGNISWVDPSASEHAA
ncbi:MAG: ribosome-associated translation inhibitor RaiA [Rickettsiales bacterium]